MPRPGLSAPGRRGPRASLRRWPCSAGTASGATTRRSRGSSNRTAPTPLTLDHLGGLIGQFLDGDPRRAPEAPRLTSPRHDRQALRLARLLDAYQAHLPPAERALLGRLCLLQRSIAFDQILRTVPVHAGRPVPDGPRPRSLGSERIPLPDGFPGTSDAGWPNRSARPSPRRSSRRRSPGRRTPSSRASTGPWKDSWNAMR